jgi:hypothetical protein
MAEAANSIAKTYDLLKWLLPAVSKFPRDKRYTLGQRIEDKLLDVLELLLSANYTRDKLALLKEANLKLEHFRYLVRLSYDLRFIDLRKYEFVSRETNEAGRMIGGWIRQQAAK